jgi:HD-GYP domain-containing protein (c-di-GMP phosphodiesterase class II)
LKGEKIPVAARMFAVVDVWDALRSDRSYRKAWPKKKVLKYLRDEAGTRFDPNVVKSFLAMLTERRSM